MCIVCHEEAHDNPVSLDLVKASPEALAAEHGDGNPECVRDSSNLFYAYCIDCGESFENTSKQREQHCCYE